MHQSKHAISSKSMSQFPPFRYTPQEPPSTTTSQHLTHRGRDRVSISNLINSVDNARITSLPSSPTAATSFASPPAQAHHQSSSATSSNLISSTGRDSARNRQRTSGSTRVRATSAQGGRTVQHTQLDDLTARRKKIQSEKKRLWRKNLSPDQKAKRQEMDAQRKREQRMNMTPEQRSEARRKDAARKAAKRRLQKEQMKTGPNSLNIDSANHTTNPNSTLNRHLRPYSSSSSSSPPPPAQDSALHPHRATQIASFPDRTTSRLDMISSSVLPSSPVDYDNGSFPMSKIHDLLN